MNIFEKIGFKLISSRLNNSEEDEQLTFSVTTSKKNGKTISLILSDNLVNNLGWQLIDRISILSDSNHRLGVTTPLSNDSTYKLIKLSSISNKRQIKFTWKPEIINEPILLKIKIEYNIVSDSNGRKGINIVMPETIFKKGE